MKYFVIFVKFGEDFMFYKYLVIGVNGYLCSFVMLLYIINILRNEFWCYF